MTDVNFVQAIFSRLLTSSYNFENQEKVQHEFAPYKSMIV